MCVTTADVMTGCWLPLASAKAPRRLDFAAVAGALAELRIAEDAIPDPTIRQAKAETVRSTLAACRRIESFPRDRISLSLVAPDGKTVHRRRLVLRRSRRNAGGELPQRAVPVPGSSSGDSFSGPKERTR